MRASPKTFVVIGLALCQGLATQAQFFVELKGTIDLPTGRWADSVLVAFDPASPIGIIHTERTAETVHAYFKDPVDVALQKVLRKPGSVPATGPELVIKVNKLHLEEFGVAAQCGLHLEVLERTGTRHVRRFEYGTTVTSKKGETARDDHSRNILRALRQCLAAFVLAEQQGRLTDLPVADSLLHTPMHVGSAEAPILGEGWFEPGLYHTFMDMRMDKPDTTFSIAILEKAKSAGDDQVVHLLHLDRSLTDSIWGFNNGYSTYKNLGGNNFIRLDRSGGIFRASIPPPENNHVAVVAVGGALFGVIGAVAVAAGSSAPTGPIACELDMLSGDLRPTASIESQSALKVLHIFHYSRFAEKNVDLRISYGDAPAVTLKKRQWMKVEPTPGLEKLVVTVRSVTGETYAVELDTNVQRTEVYLIDVDKDGTITVNRSKEPMASSVIDDLKAENERR